MSQSMAAVRSLFIPLESATLLLPGTVVAEIVPYTEATPPEAGSPSWLMGSVLWREQRIPLVSIDAILSGEPPLPGRRARIAVLKAVSNVDDMPYYGIVTKQIPRLVTVFEESIEALEEDWSGHAVVAAEVLANGEPAVIPDVAAIEAMLHSALNP